MMNKVKKIISKQINILVIISMLTLTFVPVTTVEAKPKTLQDYKNEVARLENEEAENNRLTESTKAEIDRKRNSIIKANDTIAANEQSVEASKTKVAESKEQIKIKNEELKDVINVLQYSKINSDEVYMDFIFDSASIPELMERQAVVQQIIDYTQEELEGLDKLIKDNEKLQENLANDNVKLTDSISEYEKKVQDLEAYIEKLASIGMDKKEKIKAQRSLIKTFENAGCKNNDSIDECYYNKREGSSSFSRPLNSGRVTQAWGHNGHAGIDLGGNPKGTPVYAPANGTVAHVAYRQSCGGNIIYIHHTVGGKAYTTEYAHLTSIKVRDGQYVRKGQIIATVGGDSSTFWYDHCTSGTHLHYSVAYGYYLGSGSNGYSSWSKFRKNTRATSSYSITGLKNKYRWTWSGRN